MFLFLVDGNRDLDDPTDRSKTGLFRGFILRNSDPALDRTVILRAVTQELGPTREAVLDAVMQRLDLSQKHAAEAYTLAEQFETNPRSVWGYVQGLTRLSQHTPWQDGRFAVDRAASRLLYHGPLTLVAVRVRPRTALSLTH